MSNYMYYLTREIDLNSAHYLPKHLGKCARMHGHRWKVQMMVGSDELNEQGMVVDFAVLKEALRVQVTDVFDHRDINEILDCPTAEHMAKVFFDLLNAIIKTLDTPNRVELIQVQVWETADSSVIYARGN